MKALLPAALCLAALPALAETVSPEIGFFEAGVLCSPDDIATAPAPDTIAGFTNIIEGDPPFVSTGRVVPGVIGVSFGVKSQAAKADFPAVTIVVTHPPMGPEGVTRQSYSSDIIASDTSLTFYELEYDYEVVLGDWTFTAMDGDRVLFSTTFTVVPPAQIPELAGICGYEDLLS